MKITPYLRLFRIPAVFTAIADIICGYFIVNPEWKGGKVSLILLLVSSAFLYTGGMIMNDYFDYEVDRSERPTRPIPAGDISRTNALLFCILFSAVGIVSAFYAGIPSFYISLLLLLSIVIYNCLAKDNPMLGPLNMGICRFLNMSLGMSIAIHEIRGRIVFPLLLMSYIIGVTILSRIEAGGGKRDVISIALFPVGLLITMVIIFSITGYFNSKAPMLFLIPFIFFVVHHFRKIYIEPDPVNIQNCVKGLIISVILVDAMFLSGFKGLSYGIILLLLLLPSVLSARLIYIT